MKTQPGVVATNSQLKIKDQQILDSLLHTSNDNSVVIHISTRGKTRAKVVWHKLEKSFSVLMFTSKSPQPLLLDPLNLKGGHSIRAAFKFVLLQVEVLFRELLGPQVYDTSYSSARDVNLPKELVGYENMTLAVNFDSSNLMRRISTSH